MPKRDFCAWSTQKGGNCVGGGALREKRPRPALSELSGNARKEARRNRSSRVQTGCKVCQVNLCIKKGCFEKFHAKHYSN